MPIEFQVDLEDKPGSLAWLGSVLDDANVNIDAIHGRSGRGTSAVHFVVNDPGRAADALDEAGIAFSEREVVCVNVLNQPGALRDVALVLSEAGINIDSVYGNYQGGVILGVDDPDGATQVAAGLDVMKSD